MKIDCSRALCAAQTDGHYIYLAFLELLSEPKIASDSIAAPQKIVMAIPDQMSTSRPDCLLMTILLTNMLMVMDENHNIAVASLFLMLNLCWD